MSAEHFAAAANALAQLVAEALRPVVVETIRAEIREALDTRVAQPAPRLLTVQEAAERLHVCPETVRREHRKGTLPGVTALGALRFRPEDLERFIESEHSTRRTRRSTVPKSDIITRGCENGRKTLATTKSAVYGVNNAEAKEAE
jgi:excisionase family DNA binding protein